MSSRHKHSAPAPVSLAVFLLFIGACAATWSPRAVAANGRPARRETLSAKQDTPTPTGLPLPAGTRLLDGRRIWDPEHAPRVQLVETVPLETHLGNPDVPAAKNVWIGLVRSARRSLDFEEFYLSDWPGEPLRPVLDEIGRAAARGVKVRLLLDARMHRTYPQPADSLGKLPGIEVRTIDVGKLSGGVQHSKYFVVDGRTICLGSQNMDWRALEHIHELGVCIQDSALTQVFQDLYELDWKLAVADSSAAPALVAASATHEAPVYRVERFHADTVDVWPGYTPRGWIPDSSLWDETRILATIAGARREVVLQLLTYSPEVHHERDAALDQALRDAAARGVHVRLMISDWNTGRPNIDFLKQLTALPNVEVRLGTVPEWSGGYIPFARVEHCKYMVVDSLWTWVGTSNWEPDYFHKTRNVGVTLRSRGMALLARKIFEASWSSTIAQPVRADAEYKPSQHGDNPPPGHKKYGG